MAHKDTDTNKFVVQVPLKSTQAYKFEFTPAAPGMIRIRVKPLCEHDLAAESTHETTKQAGFDYSLSLGLSDAATPAPSSPCFPGFASTRRKRAQTERSSQSGPVEDACDPAPSQSGLVEDACDLAPIPAVVLSSLVNHLTPWPNEKQKHQ
ncbi:hypothetical protein CONPUDRAFT_75339 [Coniophora puteana RWD-64-598 SS2]|uniref:Uncharacterized protein n=1 Tax=Coniophora puteana (strain RWD-64-598) TaxID=741705 RepID=A0A5M3MI71_CONPW|nr:uncharacterized protein CONPUDRAFT_75339 [Coniophora puteana RWD-64-598 SS2]EIW78737.1 hypothetical protein CONPUDRAFT_75339 [Coniophora puteana RWD-64-598 SS2]